MDKIEEILKKYKAVTIEIMHDVERGDYGEIQPLFSNRELLIGSIEGMDLNMEDFKRALKQERIVEADDELRKTINSRKKQLVLQMSNTLSLNRAVASYRKSEKNTGINILNESI